MTTLDTRPSTATRKPSRRPRGPIVWLRAHIIQILAVCAFVYLLLPNLVVVIFSFNKPKGRYNLTFQQFSLDAWLHPCGAPGICESVSLSLKIGLLATFIATILGTMIAFAIVRHRFYGRSSTNLLIFMPMATPEVVMGSSLLTLFVGPLHVIPLGFRTILIAHIMFCISFVVVTVKARLAGLDPRLEQAAMDLYANEYQTFRRITLPLVAPGIAAAALLVLLAVVRRLHHHELQREPQHADLPDVRLGRVHARHPGPDQRHRHHHVRRVAARCRWCAARGVPTVAAPGVVTDARILAALADAQPGSYWLADPARPDPSAQLVGQTGADLVVVGGGYTGLWTALLAKERNPGRDVVVLESHEAGWAASGRNGGFCAASLTHGTGNGLARWPDDMPTLLRLGRDNLDGIEATLDRYGLDAEWERTGALDVATAPWQAAELRAHADGGRGAGGVGRAAGRRRGAGAGRLADLSRGPARPDRHGDGAPGQARVGAARSLPVASVSGSTNAPRSRH